VIISPAMAAPAANILFAAGRTVRMIGDQELITGRQPG